MNFKENFEKLTLQKMVENAKSIIPPKAIIDFKIPDRPIPFYETIKQYINKKTKSLTENEDLVITISMSSGQIMLVSHFGYYDENFLLIHGTDIDSNKATLLTHKDNIQLLFTIVEKSIEQPRKVFGFIKPIEETEK